MKKNQIETVPHHPSLVKDTAGRIASIMTAISVLLFPQTVHASVVSANWTGGDNIDTLVGGLIGMMLTIARYAGMGLTVWGIVKTVMAYKDDNTNEITQGIRLSVVGIFLIALKSILSGLGLVS